jgi:hypothetical protein
MAHGDAPSPAGSAVDRLNAATYEDLRALNLSFEQTGRVLVSRESAGGFSSLAELDGIPGISAELLAELKEEFTAAEPPMASLRGTERAGDAASTRARVGTKYRVAFDGKWQGKFDTLEEAVEYAEIRGQRHEDDIVYVVKSSLLRKQLVTVYPESRLEEARKLWKRSRSMGGGGGGL